MEDNITQADEESFIGDLTATATTETTETTEEVATPPVEEETTTATVEETVAPTKPDKAAQQQYAFVQMRTENTAYKKAMQDVAIALGIEGTDDVPEKVRAKALEVMSKQQNVPVEILRDLEHLKARDAELTKMQNEQAAVLGFNSVKEKFGLTNDTLKEFAESLQADGINPFAQSVNLQDEYIRRNYDRLQTEAIEKGRKEEAQRAAKAHNQSTTINKAIGAEDGETKKINSVNELTKMFGAL